MRFTIVTGLSGAGRSTALKTLEDMGFFCADNLPPQLIPGFAQVTMNRVNPPDDVAVVVDMRMGDMFDSIYEAIDELNKMDLTLHILFLDASDEQLVSRFKQTRRLHPVSGSGKIMDGISRERDKLQRIKDMAHTVLDTSVFTARQLAKVLQSRFSQGYDGRLHISVVTFGYKRGIPIDADLVFDMRFLPNPFYEEALRSHTGLMDDVKEYVLGAPEAQRFLKQLTEMVKYLEPCFLAQDKKQLMIGIGCTGGMHRSVAMGEELFLRLQEAGHRVTIEHRDIQLERDSVEKRFLKAVRFND